jgi:hypothetical protein
MRAVVEEPRLQELAQVVAGLVVHERAAECGDERHGRVVGLLPRGEEGADDELASAIRRPLERAVEPFERARGDGHDGGEQLVLGSEELHHLRCVDPGVCRDRADRGAGEAVRREPRPGCGEDLVARAARTGASAGSPRCARAFGRVHASNVDLRDLFLNAC